MTNLNATRQTVPIAYVTTGRQRIKQYNESVYLNNRDEFELELFNPTTSKVMAKIELNGISIGAGIVLLPGQRVFIERYLDEAKKFLFQTYEVEGGNSDVQRAIANNGNVKVMFYKESVPVITTYPSITTWTSSWPTWGTTTYTSHIGVVGNSGINYRGFAGAVDMSFEEPKSTFTSSSNQASLDSLGYMDMGVDRKRSFGKKFDGQKLSKMVSTSLNEPKAVETGRIDKGSHSSQSFGHDYSTFDTFWTWQTQWKILPMSQKPVMSEDIKIFCTNCGAKRKRGSHKFCPHCGSKF